MVSVLHVASAINCPPAFPKCSFFKSLITYVQLLSFLFTFVPIVSYPTSSAPASLYLASTDVSSWPQVVCASPTPDFFESILSHWALTKILPVLLLLPQFTLIAFLAYPGISFVCRFIFRAYQITVLTHHRNFRYFCKLTNYFYSNLIWRRKCFTFYYTMQARHHIYKCTRYILSLIYPERNNRKRRFRLYRERNQRRKIRRHYFSIYKTHRNFYSLTLSIVFYITHSRPYARFFQLLKWFPFSHHIKRVFNNV